MEQSVHPLREGEVCLVFVEAGEREDWRRVEGTPTQAGRLLRHVSTILKVFSMVYYHIWTYSRVCFRVGWE